MIVRNIKKNFPDKNIAKIQQSDAYRQLLLLLEKKKQKDNVNS